MRPTTWAYLTITVRDRRSGTIDLAKSLADRTDQPVHVSWESTPQSIMQIQPGGAYKALPGLWMPEPGRGDATSPPRWHSDRRGPPRGAV
ncbi:MAG: hypothetical protein JWM89_1517 [Acidimicrobiales bacterium]|nr:hypothetical protein [Acidimicrobiales bacterium]